MKITCEYSVSSLGEKVQHNTCARKKRDDSVDQSRDYSVSSSTF